MRAGLRAGAHLCRSGCRAGDRSRTRCAGSSRSGPSPYPFHQGDLVSAVERMDACLDEYNRLQHRPTSVQDPGVMCLCYSAWGKWELGYPDQAVQRARQVVALSEKLNHKFSMGEAFGFRTSVHHFRGENEEALKCAERAIEICEDSGFAVWLAHAKLMRGRIVAEHGDTAAGIEEMRQPTTCGPRPAP